MNPDDALLKDPIVRLFLEIFPWANPESDFGFGNHFLFVTLSPGVAAFMIHPRKDQKIERIVFFLSKNGPRCHVRKGENPTGPMSDWADRVRELPWANEVLFIPKMTVQKVIFGDTILPECTKVVVSPTGHTVRVPGLGWFRHDFLRDGGAFVSKTDSPLADCTPAGNMGPKKP